MEEPVIALETRNINAWFGKEQILFDVSARIPKKRVTAVMGPSG